MDKRSCLHDRPCVAVSLSFCIYTLLLLLLLPLRWVLSLFAAVALHEASHMLALMICRVKMRSVTLRASGVYISSRALSPAEAVICAAAGPVGGLLGACLLYRFPRFALCAFLQSIYNLLPILPFDGGRVLYGLCGMLPKRVGQLLCFAVRTMLLILIIISVIRLTFYGKMLN